MTLCDAADPDWAVIERAAAFLASAQLGNGEMAPTRSAGRVFSHGTARVRALSDLFSGLGLAAFEERRKARATLTASVRPTRSSAAEG